MKLIYNRIGKNLMLIAENLATRYNFCRYTFKDEMIGDGILRAIEALHSKKFNYEGNYPFTYFSKVIFRTFVTRIKIEKMKRSVVEKLIITEDLFTTMPGDVFNKDIILEDFEFQNA